ncbi:AAA ATPase-like protein [Arcicella aurantiaca]|uniref:AAA ATPase-like protein n=1 Tax=Arcicella aurantiaca TaxID=591202 RepID=A0A316EEW8_9BACT|nr:AAA family ATPase [Arcicella aurantiaca]PWK28620.1 AAA ATPase-like protein [Arcicella aurantiaca]
MIIELQNFGPIKSFKFDTDKDIHAIFGKNNIGKSYAISAVYLILKNLREYDYYDGNSSIQRESATFDLEKLVEQELRDLEFVEYDVKDKIIESFKYSIETSFIPALTNSLKNSFDFQSINNNKTNTDLKIILSAEIGKIEICLDKSIEKLEVKNINLYSEFKIYDEFFKFNEIEKNIYIFIYYKKAKIITPINRISWNLNLQLRKEIINTTDTIFFLPVSRSGLYNALNSFGPIFAEISKYRLVTNAKFEIPNLSEPISDYFLNLNNIEKVSVSDKYSVDFEKIEKDILKGTIGFDKVTRKYHYIPNANPDMIFDLSATSSMISEIAPIIAHLKYIIPLESDKPSILFIEEPEAHLHPEIQILLLEYFVKLSKGNVKIVMTSHSNYIFNKLSNLLIANKVDKEKLSVSLMKMTPEGSVIEDGAMQMDEYGIEDNNFVDVAEQLYEERMSLLEKL